MIFRRRRYPLPRFPQTIIPEFRSFCEELPEERVAEFFPELDRCVEHFRALAEGAPLLNLNTVERLADVCRELLRLYPECSPKERRLIVGAVRYFASTDDAVSETAFASGLDDDVQVVNHVVEELGRDELLLRGT
ncbi:hypothetical protein MRY87_09920 [bacterium]|nr:hypothetical protein [bacterium]